MSLIATKGEVAAVTELLNSPADARGVEWTGDSMAKAVINLISSMREERRCFTLVFELSPGVYQGFGPFATRDAAFDSVDKNPMAYIAKRAAIVPLLGHKQAVAAMEAKADEPPADRSMFNIVREDASAVRRGWKGNVRDRDRFLSPVT